MIMRGGPDTVPVTQSMADSLSSQGWRWSAHTHPDGILRSSSGDRAILGPFRNTTSAILDPFGGKARFNTNGDMLDAGWLPR